MPFRRPAPRRCLALVALLGLLFQLAVSFGHVHAIEWSNGLAAHAETRSSSNGPADTDEACPICIAARLAAEGAPVAEIVLAPPVRVELAVAAFHDEAIAARPPFINFLTRGPPAA